MGTSRFLTIPLMFFLCVTCLAVSEVYEITEFGARSEPGFVNTAAINRAVETCSQNGGGTVLVPPGTWITGSLRLLSNVNLHLSAGAILKGSLNLEDYRVGETTRGLIYAYNAADISISGMGEIDGSGTSFMQLKKAHLAADFDRTQTRQGKDYMTAETFSDGPVAYENRPGMMIVLLHCQQVRIEDVVLRDSPSWTMRLGDCDDVTVRGISILNNLLVPNSDGVHCTHSRNVRISDCDIRAGDDAIIVTGFGEEINVHGQSELLGDPSGTLLGNQTGYAENVTVSNCTLQSRSAGIRVGYGRHPIRNCTFTNVVIYESNRGIGVFARDNADIENILFSDIIIQNRLHSGHWWGNGEPIHVSALPRDANERAGKIRNVRFSNILADSETGILVWGQEEGQIHNLEFNRVQLRICPSPLAQDYGGNFDLRPSASLETSIFEHDIPGLFAKNVNGLAIRQFQLSWEPGVADYHSNGIRCESVKGLRIDQDSRYPSRPGSGLPALERK